MKYTHCPLCNHEVQGLTRKTKRKVKEEAIRQEIANNGWRVRKARLDETCRICTFPLYEGAEYIYELINGTEFPLWCDACFMKYD